MQKKYLKKYKGDYIESFVGQIKDNQKVGKCKFFLTQHDDAYLYP